MPVVDITKTFLIDPVAWGAGIFTVVYALAAIFDNGMRKESTVFKLVAVTMCGIIGGLLGLGFGLLTFEFKTHPISLDFPVVVIGLVCGLGIVALVGSIVSSSGSDHRSRPSRCDSFLLDMRLQGMAERRRIEREENIRLDVREARRRRS